MRKKILHCIFITLLSLAVIFELVYFINLDPFFYNLSLPEQHLADPFEIALKRKIAKLSLEEKIGYLFVIGFPGTTLTPTTKRFTQKHHFKNFLLFSRNIETPEQLKQLTDALKAEAGACLIAVDEEGGAVNRIKFKDFDKTAQADIVDIQQAEQIAENRAVKLKELGINVNFAPVVEYPHSQNSFLVNQQRAFPADKILPFSKKIIESCNQQSIIAVAKHFPGGLGREDSDPHTTLPEIDIDSKELAQDLSIFKQLIEEQILKAIMTTHLKYPQIDPENPVTTSEKFIRSILKGELGFKGVVISDDLRMKGISSTMTVEQAAVDAILAGHDLLIVSSPQQLQSSAYQHLLKAVEDGKIEEKRIDRSVKKILLMK